MKEVKTMRIDAVQTIKDRLTMREVLLRYGYEPKRRMKCPLHNGDGLNFEVKEHSFMCYSQCGGGDVITFVQKLFDLPFQDALKKIDLDFGLNLYGEHTFEELRKSHYQTKQLQAKREREKEEQKQADTEYWAVFDEWKRLDDNKQKFAPKTLDAELNPLFIEALQKLTHQEYLLDCAEERRARV
jgi:DNA primase